MRRTNLRVTLGSNDQVLQGVVTVHEDDGMQFELVIEAWDTRLHVDAMLHELLAQYYRWTRGELPGQQKLL